MEETSAQTAENERGRCHGWGIFLVIFGMLVAYPLSVGPVIKLVEKKVIPKSVFWVYLPLGQVCEHCPPAMRLYRWYLGDVWGVR